MAEINEASEVMIRQAQEKLRKLEEEVRSTKKFVNQILAFAGKQPLYPEDDPGSSSSLTGPHKGDEYVGKSQITACREILERRKRADAGPATVEELYRDLLAGGYKFEAKEEATAKRGIYQTLTRQSGTFYKLQNKKFGLTAWYPGVKVKKNGDDGEGQDQESEGTAEAATATEKAEEKAKRPGPKPAKPTE